MDIESMCRVGTRITCFTKQNNHAESVTFILQDVCLIYEDQENKGYYIALSQPTSKVGFGQSREDAYVDLIVALVCAIRHGLKREKRPQLGVESNKKVWVSLNRFHRMTADEQSKLLEKASKILPECKYEKVKTTKEKQIPVTLQERELDATAILEMLRDDNVGDTAMALDAISDEVISDDSNP